MAAKKTVYTVLKEKGLLNNSRATLDFLNGKKVVILSQTGGHNYGKTGEKFVITVFPGNSYMSSTSITYVRPQAGGNTIQYTSMEFCEDTVENLKDSIEDNNKSIADLQKENIIIAGKIKFMEDNSLSEYDENLFKVSEVLKQLDNKKLKGMDRAKAIAALIK